MKTTKSILLTLAMLLIVSCTSRAPEATVNAVTSTPEVPHTLTPTIKPTETSTPTNTPTLIPTLIWTPLPTLSPHNRDAKVRELLETNGSCKLPCWWNIVPGKTEMQFAIQDLRTFAGYERINIDNGVIIGTFSFVASPQTSTGFIDLTLTSRGYTVDQIEVAQLNSWKYQIPTLLQTYGIPTSVWVRTYKPDYENNPYGWPYNDIPFLLVLFYQDQGIMAMFKAETGQAIDANVRGCMIDSAELTLWSPIQNIRFNDASKGKWGSDPFMRLEDATGIDSKTFYQSFKNGDRLICIDTPANLWPGQ